MGRKWTEKQERRLRDALTLAAQAESEVRRLSIALEECQMQPDRRAWEEHAAQQEAEVDRLRSVIEKIALGGDMDALVGHALHPTERVELTAAIAEIRSLYAYHGPDEDFLAKAAHEIRTSRLALRDVSAFVVPAPGGPLLLRTLDGVDRHLTVESVAPIGEYGFAITFEGDPQLPGAGRLVPESREDYLRRRGWHGPLGPLEEWNRSSDGWRVYGTAGAYKQQVEEDAPSPPADV